MTESQPVLRVRELTVRFGDTDPPAVDDVSFHVSRGEVLAVVGESGSGKTVSAQAVLGLLPRTARASGSVRLGDGPEMLNSDESTWAPIRGAVAAMVFQEPQTALNPVRTIGWQLTEAIRAHQRISRAAARLRAFELLDLVGIPEPRRRLNSYPHQLSGGQKQRVVIALALANDPMLLIADEPTTALDVTVQIEILNLLGDLRRRLGTAILLITHNMGVVADQADRVLVMKSGRMVEHGAVESLFAAPVTGYTRELLAAVPRLSTLRSLSLSKGSAAVREAPRTPDSPALQVIDATIDYRGRFGRPGFQALAEVSVEVRRGEVLGIVGESGSGKTTLARAAVGALTPTLGQVIVAGTDLASVGRAGLRTLRSRLGIVHQDPATTLDPLLRVGDSIAEPLQVHRAATGQAVRDRVGELLEAVQLPASYARRLPNELSGGQRQRVALARALALRPALLIADEPTSALDVSVQAAILKLFAELQQELGFACLFISHDLAVVNEISDTVAVLRGGRVVEQGLTSVVLSRPETSYTRRLLDAVPIPDPVEQRRRSRIAPAELIGSLSVADV